MGKTRRSDLLHEAEVLVTESRNVDYDEPGSDFERISVLWSALLDTFIEPHQVAMMMILLKMARLQHRPDFYDSWLDIAGYAACGYDVAAVDTTTIAELLDQKISEAKTAMEENFSATIWATPQTPDMNRGPYWKEVVNEDAKPEDNFFLDTYPTSQWQHLDRSEPWDE